MEIGCVERIKMFLQRKGRKIHHHTYRNNLLKSVTLTPILYFQCTPDTPRAALTR